MNLYNQYDPDILRCTIPVHAMIFLVRLFCDILSFNLMPNTHLSNASGHSAAILINGAKIARTCNDRIESYDYVFQGNQLLECIII